MQSKTIQNLFSVTEIELTYRNPKRPSERPRIQDPQRAYDIFLSAWDMNKIELQEEFKIMLLDRANHCIGISHVAAGGTSSCLVDPKLVFATALKARASGIICAHNHPSGSIEPSDADIQLTEKLKAGGKLLDISMLDHLIISPHGLYSMANEGPVF